MPAPSLRIVPDANGEIPKSYVELKLELTQTLAVVKGLERDIRGWRIRYDELARDKATEAREHVLWPLAKRLFQAWQAYTGHRNAHWTTDRFWMLEPWLTMPQYGKTLDARVLACCEAIAGARYDSFSKPRRNNTVKTYNEFERIFGKGAGSFEEFRARAPVGWVPTISPALATLIIECEARLERQAQAAKLERKARA